ncbi:MAG: zinc-binding dehydrogenase [Clostridia bacterium]|nr:zinc-binding dehydrogenase [Clostridia bacterium]
MPKEILSYTPHELSYASYEEKPLASDEIRVRVDYAAPKHGSELHGWRSDPDAPARDFDAGTKCFMEKPRNGGEEAVPGAFRPGNMWVGRVTETGSAVASFRVGDRVAGYGCLRETQTVPVDKRSEPGLGFCVDVLHVPEEMPWQAALSYDPCQFAMSGVRDAHVRLGDVCLISGLGAVGLLAAELARLQGAGMVIVSDPIERRRRIALENGADYAFDPLTEDVGLAVKRLSANRGADAVIETSGSYPGLQTALRAAAYGARIAVVGWFQPCRGAFDLGLEAHMNNATIFFSRACSEPNPDYPRWNWERINRECWRLLSSGKLSCEKLFDPVVSFQDAAETYLDVVDRHPEKSVKMGVRFL